MRYGKIRVEDGNLIFFRHMIQNNLPCRDIVWAYIHREGENAEEAVKQMISNYLVIITRRKKRYQFEMTEHEATGLPADSETFQSGNGYRIS